MVQWAKVLADKPDDLSSVSRTHMTEENNFTKLCVNVSIGSTHKIVVKMYVCTEE